MSMRMRRLLRRTSSYEKNVHFHQKMMMMMMGVKEALEVLHLLLLLQAFTDVSTPP
jgi:hypothetical protein